MAKWQDLLTLLQDQALTPRQIIERMNLRPSKLRRMLGRQRLRAHLDLLQSLALVRAQDATVATADKAAHRLSVLMESEQPESARKACVDMMAAARAAVGERARPEKPPRRLPINMPDGTGIDPNDYNPR